MHPEGTASASEPPGGGTTPRVLSSTPADGATDVAVNESVSVTFSEEMDRATLTGGTFTVTSGPSAVPDFANPAQMNHFTWYDTHDWTTPYPGESKIYAPNQVPGAYIPSSDSDG